MRSLSYSLILLFLFVGHLVPLQAKVMYVTERIILGVHTEPDEESPLLASINSGSPIEVLEENEGFNQVKLSDGRIGWVSAGYLVNEEPATAQLDKVIKQLALSAEKYKIIEVKLSKKDRELQVRNDQLSNARTSIREYKKKLKAASKGTPPAKVDTAMAEELAAANQQIEKLKTQLSEENKSEVIIIEQPGEDVSLQLAQAKEETETLQNRIKFALANLSGEYNPEEIELQRLNQQIPVWIWAAVMIALIGGLIAGILAMDYWVRRRHGGFRL
jgi:SH3 domain protein